MPDTTPLLLIRADATPSMGTGHVMRCLALALAARERHIDARLICRIRVPWVLERLAREDVSCVIRDEDPPATELPGDLLQHLSEAAPDACAVPSTWVITDGYHFTQSCQTAVREAGYHLLCIDDYAHLPAYDCDILLNQNTGSETLLYSGTIGSALLGPAYALLRPEFLHCSPHTLNRNRDRLHMLLTLGGGNSTQWLDRLAPTLCLPVMKNVDLFILTGSMKGPDILEAFRDTPASVHLLPRVDDMASLLQDMDLCITAGGSTCLELACMGIPFLTISIADNQARICSWLDKNAYAPHFSEHACRRLIEDAAYRTSLSVSLRQLVDGRGATRVIDAILDRS